MNLNQIKIIALALNIPSAGFEIGGSRTLIFQLRVIGVDLQFCFDDPNNFNNGNYFTLRAGSTWSQKSPSQQQIFFRVVDPASNNEVVELFNSLN